MTRATCTCPPLRHVLSLFLNFSCSIYINSPGSGKTATLFTALTLRWGLYLAFSDERRSNLAGEKAHGYGSQDLSVLLKMMVRHSEWKQATTAEQFEANRTIVQRCVGMLIVVRLAVLLRFLDSVPKSWSVAVCRLQWLLMQAAPGLTIRGAQTIEIFQSLVEKLRITTGPNARAVHEFDCVALATQLWTKIYEGHRHLIQEGTSNTSPPFVAVIDEAQQAVELYKDFLRSDRDINIKRPLLAEIQKTIHWSYKMVTRLVYSGTGLSMRYTLEPLSSGTMKAGEMVTRHQAGVFNEGKILGRWLYHHFADPTIDWMLRPETNPIHNHLLIRTTKWLPGRFVDRHSSLRFVFTTAHSNNKYRPRLSAAWGDILLPRLRDSEHPLALHGLFNMYVFMITNGWTPNDGADMDASVTLSKDDLDALRGVKPAVDIDKLLKAAQG